MQTQSDTQTRKEVVFGDNGETIEETVVETAEPDAETVSDETEIAEPNALETAPAVTKEGAGRYRIGDKWFNTQDEALAFAQRQEEISNAYRQGMREGLNQPGRQGESVTPSAQPKPDLNVDELYTNPQEFLAKYARQIKTEATTEVERKTLEREQSERIWREFTDRHPVLADFREDVESFVAKNQPDVVGIINSQGRDAAYDYVATKLKAKFTAFQSALKPKRELPNGGGGASPSTGAASVTPKTQAKKPLSFAEQVRSIKTRR